MAKTTLALPDHIDLVEFVAVQAHDLRSPFNQVIGFTKIMLNGQDGPLTDLLREDLTTVYKSSLRALMLINNLIDIARLTRGDKDAGSAAVDVKLLVEQAVAQWKKFNPAKDMQIETRLPAEPLALRGEEPQLRGLLSGLMAYAAEYVAEPARLSLEVFAEADRGVLTVASVGPKAPVPSAFDLLMLGYLSRALVELHGGDIRRAETSDEGALIRISLPQATA